MDDAILRAILLDHTGTVDVETLARLLQSIRKIVGTRTIEAYEGTVSAHGAGHLATGLDAPKRQDFVRKGTGEPYHVFTGEVECDGQPIEVVLFCNDEETAEEAARGEVARGQ